MTNLLRALCALKPIRDVIVKLFTQDKFDAEEVDFECISTQLNIGDAIPDMCIQNINLRIAVEIKTSDWRGLTANQPQVYLRWLTTQQAQDKFFVFLKPPHYSDQQWQEYSIRKNVFCAANPGHGITFVEITWADVLSALEETGLSSTCIYTRDFENLIKEWYFPTPIRFTHNELRVTSMFNTDAGNAIFKIFKFVDQIESEFKRAGFTVIRRPRRQIGLNSRDYVYGFDIECGGKNVLFLGLWMAFWMDHGFPLCISVWKGYPHPEVLQRFATSFADHFEYPLNDPNPSLVKGIIDQHLLMENAVHNVSEDLLKYLNEICAEIKGKSA